MRIKSVFHKFVQTFSQRFKPQTTKFLALDEHSHVEYIYYLKKLCMFPVRLVNNCRFLLGERTECLKIGLNHTEFCAHRVRGLQIVQTFSQHVKPQTSKFLVSDEHSRNLYMDYLKKLCMFPVRLVNNCRFLLGERTECLKIGLNHTEFCAHRVRGLQIVQTFSQHVKPQTSKFLVSDEHSRNLYMDYLKKLCMFPVCLINNYRFL